MRRLFLASLFVLGSCSPQVPASMTWSLSPRDNLLARVLADPVYSDGIWLRMNLAVSALQARGRQQPELSRCEETPLPRCTYEVRLVEKSGGRTAACRRVLFEIGDTSPGALRVAQMKSETFDCPADLQ